MNESGQSPIELILEELFLMDVGWSSVVLPIMGPWTGASAEVDASVIGGG